MGRFRTRLGLTIIESLLAVTLLAGLFLAVSYSFVAGHQHLHHSDEALRAVRLGKDLLEEIVSNPPAYRGSFTAVSDYDGYSEALGAITDFAGNPYPEPDQQYSRSVSVTADTQAVPDLGTLIAGHTVTITVTHRRGETWEFERFIPD